MAQRLTRATIMASYYLNEAVFDRSERPFVDKTIHGLEAKLESEATLGVLVHRTPVAGDKPLRALVDENVALNKKRLIGYDVLEECAAPVGGVAGILLRTSWRNERRALYQAQAHVVVDGRYMVFAVSAPLDERAACEETFDSILTTLTWRTES
jgi:hypothetical protein